MVETPTRDREQEGLPDRVTMPLLTLVTRDAVDEDYVHAAQRREAAGEGASTPRGPGLRGAAVATAAFGLLIALAAVQTARNADVQEAGRDALIDRIDERKTEVASLDDRIDGLQQTNTELRSSNARARGQLANATVDLRTLELSSGYVPVSGPGLRITVSDNPDQSADGRVRATDLRRLVNGLWRAGAQTGQEFQSLSDQFGFVVDRHDESELQLPSAPDNLRRLRYVDQGGGPPDNQEDVP